MFEARQVIPIRRPKRRASKVSSVPFLSREHIELKAEELLDWIRPSIRTVPCLTPVAEIAERLTKEFEVEVRVDCDLGYSANGKKILGMCQFRPRIIYLDRILDPNLPRYRFTMAHELGHLILHRNLVLDADELDIAQNEIRDDRTHLHFARKEILTPRDRLEWQANAFASALLIPRSTLKKAVVKRQKELEVRRAGTIFVDSQPANIVAYYEMLRHLNEIYQVSKTALNIRLKERRILEDRRTFSVKHIAALFREA